MKVNFKLSALVCLLLSSAAYADGHRYKDQPVANCDTLMDGFYAGVQVGYDAYDISQRSNFTGGGVVNPDVNVNGFVGGLLLGYGKNLSDYFYLGGEMFGNLSNSETSWQSGSPLAGTYTSKTTINGSYGLALLPGIKVNPASLAYIRLGYNWVSIKEAETLTGFTGMSKTSTLGGFSYGLGLETLLASNWSVRTEYNFANYSSLNTSFSAADNTKIDPSDNQFMVSLLYHVA